MTRHTTARCQSLLAAILIFSFVSAPLAALAEEVPVAPVDASANTQVDAADRVQTSGGTAALTVAADAAASVSYESNATTREMQVGSTQEPPLAVVDENSGALGYTYSFTLPPGRGGIQPRLALSYSSADRNTNTGFGYGWSLSLPTISRVPTHGTDRLYQSSDFVSSLDGALVSQGGTEYVARAESGEKHSYSYDGTSWIMVDGGGTRYFFGTTAQARQDDALAPARVYQWRIEQIRDTNDNVVRFEYTKDSGQLYPARMVYVGQGAVDGIYTVTFARELYAAAATHYNTDFPVATKYRITGVTVAVAGVPVRSYDLAFTTGDAGYRSMLASITETGHRGGVDVALEPTTFTYQKRGPVRFDEPPNGAYRLPAPTYVYHSTQPPALGMVRDVTGDAYPDQLLSIRNTNSSCEQKSGGTLINNANGSWLEPVGCGDAWMPPIVFKDNRIARLDAGVRMVDYDGDMLPDLVRAVADNIPRTTTEPGVPIAQAYRHAAAGGSGWTAVASTSMPVGFVFGALTGADAGTETLDINADGFPDIVYGWLNDDGYGMWQRVYIGDGTARWIRVEDTTQWQFPYYLIDENEMGPEYRSSVGIADINGDTLPDIVFRAKRSQGQFINSGHGWLPDVTNNWDISFYTEYPERYSTNGDAGTRATDINGDGLIDFVRMWKHNLNTACEAYINTGREEEQSQGAFVESPCSSNEEYFAYDGTTNNLMLVDINADGMDDLVFHVYDDSSGVDTSWVHVAQGTPFTDMLIGVQTSQGASMTAAYKMSAKYVDSRGALLNDHLPILVPTVASLSVSDGMGTTAITSYEYADGWYYYGSTEDRRFAGFGKVQKTDPAGVRTTTWYHQGNGDAVASSERGDDPSKIGKPYRVEVRDAQGALLSLDTSTWGLVRRVAGAAFVPLATSTSLTYDGNASHRDTAVEYAYTPTGYLLTKTEYGEVSAQQDGTFVDKGTDARITNYTYSTNTAEKFARLASETLTNATNTVLRKTRHFYDALPYGFVAKGNETRTERLLTAPSTYVSVQKTYNLYGLVTRAVDERGNATTITYDANNLYPALVSNALGQATAYEYDYASGKPTRITDTNALRSETEYDALGRVREERVTDRDDITRLVPKTQYRYVDTGMPRSVRRTDLLDAASSVTSVAYQDGLARTRQVRTLAPGGQYRVADTEYDMRGLVSMQSLPYLSAGEAWSSPTTNAALRTEYAYDALARPVSARTNLGTTYSSYDDWVVRTTDPLGRVRAVAQDAFGQLATVIEQTGGLFYYTNYAYDAAGLLTKITDAAKNVRSFTYDLLGRRTMAEDLHAPADTTFGVWRTEYDVAGNVVKTTSPRGISIVYTYDALNRVSTEDTPSTAGVDAVYTYDAATAAIYSIGKLSRVTTPSVTTGYAYDTQGRQVATSRLYPGQTTQYFWNLLDRQGNLVYQYYPDTMGVQYLYGAEGALTAVLEWEPSGAGPNTIVSSMSYAPNGQVSRIQYGSGVVSAPTVAGLPISRVSLMVAPTLPLMTRSAQLAATTSPSLVVTTSYDPLQQYRLTARTGVLGTTTLQALSYTYDAVGNITTLDDASPSRGAKTVLYKYDDLNRLVSASTTRSTYDTPYAQTYTYSPIGNILTRSGVQNLYQGSGGASYANPHAPTFTAGTALTYDTDGNLLTWGTTYTNTWDYKGRLSTTSYLAPSATSKVSSEYRYDAAGARISATTGGTTTYYPFPAVSKTGTSVLNTILLGSTPIATIERVGTSTPKTHYALTDYLESVLMEMSPQGVVEQTIDYFPYGQTRVNKTPKYNSPRTYLGEYGDPIALSYLNARYYDGRRGAFLSQDPMFWALSKELLADPQQQNSYSYARNNPIAGKDPSGLVVEAIAKAIEGYHSGTHVFLLLKPDHPKDFGGKEQWTVGGYADNDKGSLIKAVDAGSDVDVVTTGNLLKAREVVMPSQGLSDTEFIRNIMKQYDAYQQDATYDPFTRSGYNSNNFATTLLTNAGADRLPFGGDAPGIDPGYGMLIPTDYIKADGTSHVPSNLRGLFSTFSVYAGNAGYNAVSNVIVDSALAVGHALIRAGDFLSSK